MQIKKVDLLLVLLILSATIYLFIATYFRWIQLHVSVGAFFVDHWLVIVGVLFVAVFTPLHIWLKRRFPKRIQTLIRIHTLGNLSSFMLISMHFAQQIGRPAEFYPDLGTGIALYAVMVIMVVTGLLQWFRIAITRLGKYWRFVHTSVAISFYLIIVIHILQGFRVI